jgi:hypothetical protein
MAPVKRKRTANAARNRGLDEAIVEIAARLARLAQET